MQISTVNIKNISFRWTRVSCVSLVSFGQSLLARWQRLSRSPDDVGVAGPGQMGALLEITVTSAKSIS